MGQEQSNPKLDCCFDHDSGRSRSRASRSSSISKRNHEYFVADSNLEYLGDLDSIINTLQPTIDNNAKMARRGSESSEIMLEDNTKQTVRRVLRARSQTFIDHISETYPEKEDTPLSRLHVETMVEVTQYCTGNTRHLLSTVNDYFNSVIRISCRQADLYCTYSWVNSINRSPFLQKIILRHRSDPEEIKRFCKIIENDGFPNLRYLKLVYLTDDNLCHIFKALDTWIARYNRLELLSPTDSFVMHLKCYEISQAVCYSFAEAVSNSLFNILGSLIIKTEDVVGIFNFLKTVDLHNCHNLSEIRLETCPLETRSFELLVRSLWPKDEPVSNLPPIRILKFKDTQIQDCGLLSLCQVMERGALLNLEVLDVSSNTLTAKSLYVLTQALTQYLCPNLRVLLLGNNYIVSEYSTLLFKGLANGICPLMEDVDFGNTGLTAQDFREFSDYISTPFSENLTRINLSCNPLISEAIDYFFEALINSNCLLIKTMYLEGIKFSSNHMPMFCKWLLSGKATKFRNLVIKSNFLDSDSFLMLLSTLINPQCPRMEVIDFSRNLIGHFNENDWLHLLSQDGESVDFEQVDYSFNPLTDNDMRLFLMFMATFSHLEKASRVTFDDNEITYKTLEFYFNALPVEMCSINYIVVDTNNLAGIGKCLYNFLISDTCRNVETLSLRDCCLTKEDLNYLLCALEKNICSQLFCFRLDGNIAVDDDFIDRFLDIILEGSLPNLYNLECSYTAITRRGIEMMESFLKNNPYSRLKVVSFMFVKIGRKLRSYYKKKFRNELEGYLAV